MSIFSKIKDAIFGKKAEAREAPRTRPSGHGTTDAPVIEARPKPVIDVENHLDSMPGADSLNWRTSIVDLMKLLGIDSDYEARKALASEMGREDYAGSAEDNIWLHRRVMNGLATNGGKVPAEFLD
ncbi:DUF3597 domain-containing protein [Qipengyuania sp.]|uniref:DUF3597 domain-containing protein n=1 Tax=Qipengyuania sp. TaxID=2004515 RepID=UPI003514EF20